ncbi:MAG TPA: hypothetical protein VFT42_11110 [Solirubrobacteraceae bacterium]|nr:hypothetical protein [Solirubrobacteraceae bacterium]
MSRRAALGAVAGACALAAAGCGAEAPDLFLLTRSGSIPDARLRLRVTDDGQASCNGRPLVEITSAQLIAAREVQRDATKLAKRGARLPPQRGSVLSYTLRTQDGSVRFSDDSLHQPPVLFRAAALARSIAQGACRLPR